MTSERARYLLTQYLQHRCSPAEEQELSAWMLDPANDARLQALVQDLWTNFVPSASMESDKADQILSRILQTAGTLPEKQQSVRMGWLRWSAAAAALLVISMATYKYFYSSGVRPVSPHQMAVAAPARSDVPPGNTRAVLTLSDGSTVLLDSSSVSPIASQGNARIVQEQGKLVYRNNTAGAGEVLYNTLSTQRGHQFSLALSDGTKVMLNAGSSIRFPVTFSSGQRSVQVTGEVYFEVAAGRTPFSVRAGNTRVDVLGTHFNINAYADEDGLNTTLLEGAVRISGESSSVLLSPGQQAQMRKNGTIQLNKNVDTEEVISWTQGYFHFSNASLQMVLRQISRWYDVDVVYEQTPGSETFGGDIQKSLSLSQVLKLLDKSQVKFRIEGKKLIVMQ